MTDIDVTIKGLKELQENMESMNQGYFSKICENAIKLLTDQPGWISVKDKRPTYDDLIRVLLRKSSGCISSTVANTYIDEFEGELPEKYKITHWMKIPKVPTES